MYCKLPILVLYCEFSGSCTQQLFYFLYTVIKWFSLLQAFFLSACCMHFILRNFLFSVHWSISVLCSLEHFQHPYIVIFWSLFTGTFPAPSSWFSRLCSPEHFQHLYCDFPVSVHWIISSTIIMSFCSLFTETFPIPVHCKFFNSLPCNLLIPNEKNWWVLLRCKRSAFWTPP